MDIEEIWQNLEKTQHRLRFSSTIICWRKNVIEDDVPSREDLVQASLSKNLATSFSVRM